MGDTIVGVEDFSDARDLVRLVLETEGYRVIEPGNGIDAVETAQLELPSVVSGASDYRHVGEAR